jgi:hypothetical protein
LTAPESPPPGPADLPSPVEPTSVGDAVTLAYAEGGATMVLAAIYLILASVMVDLDHIPLWLVWFPVAQFAAPTVLLVGAGRLKRGHGRAAYLTGMALLLGICATYFVPPVVDQLGFVGDHVIPTLTAAGVAGCSIIGLILVLRSSTTRYLRLRRAARSLAFVMPPGDDDRRQTDAQQ